MPTYRPFSICLVVAVTAGKVGPDYAEPEVAVKDEWRASVEAEMLQEEPDIEKWWESLEDPVLTELIRQAEVANLDLRIAVARGGGQAAGNGCAAGSKQRYPYLRPAIEPGQRRREKRSHDVKIDSGPRIQLGRAPRGQETEKGGHAPCLRIPRPTVQVHSSSATRCAAASACSS